MTDYTSLRPRLEVPTNDDYTRPEFAREAEYTTSHSYRLIEKLQATTGGKTIDLGNYSDVKALVVVNLDATNFVEATWYYQYGSRAAGTLAFANSGTDDTITDSAALGTFVTNGALAGGYVRVAAAEDAANDGAHLIQATTADILTLTSASTITANTTDTAATLSFEAKNVTRVHASGHIVVQDVHPAGDLVITADTASCDVEVWGICS